MPYLDHYFATYWKVALGTLQCLDHTPEVLRAGATVMQPFFPRQAYMTYFPSKLCLHHPVLTVALSNQFDNS